MVDVCPACGFNRALYAEMVSEPPVNGLETQNHAMARAILANCPACWDYCKKEKNELRNQNQ